MLHQPSPAASSRRTPLRPSNRAADAASPRSSPAPPRTPPPPPAPLAGRPRSPGSTRRTGSTPPRSGARPGPRAASPPHEPPASAWRSRCGGLRGGLGHVSHSRPPGARQHGRHRPGRARPGQPARRGGRGPQRHAQRRAARPRGSRSEAGARPPREGVAKGILRRRFHRPRFWVLVELREIPQLTLSNPSIMARHVAVTLR